MSRRIAPKNQFAKALKAIRVARRLSQEEFGIVSSRTYVSSLERGNYSPTLNKVDELAEVLDVHPLLLLTFAYAADMTKNDARSLLSRIEGELNSILG